ncbi:MAG: hypothetical protein EBX51_06885 [Acidimicrobiia bacterium]|nr:hypothetical protein [Acidimicrobiia bacterium]
MTLVLARLDNVAQRVRTGVLTALQHSSERLAVITSVGTAANEDVMKTLAESRFGFQIAEYDVRVQGPEAPGMIANALQHASRRDDLDAVLLIRGGGAKNELAIFDDEGIALAIARCRHPVLTGIGHETDRTIADEVAFSGFKTPTACAKFVVEYQTEIAIDRVYLRLARDAHLHAVG